MLHRRIDGFLLLISMMAGLFAAVLFYSQAPEPLVDKKNDIAFTIGEISYTFSVSGAYLGEPVRSNSDERPLRRRTMVSIPLMDAEPIDTSIDRPEDEPPAPVPVQLGTLTLTFDETDEGTVFYLESQTSASITAALAAQASGLPTVRNIPFDAEEVPKAASPQRTPYDADSALYIAAGDTHLYLSRIASISPLGQTVFSRAVPQIGASISMENDMLTLSIPLPVGRAVCSGVATAQPLINWGIPDANFNVLSLNASSGDYHLMSSGVYMAMPDSYRPHAGEENLHIYRTASALLLGPCTYRSNGPMFTALGKSIIYSYMDIVNQYGYIPTMPSSTWLLDDYGIDAGFFDTRFNFDTMKRLMRAETEWTDPEIGRTVRRVLQFYCDFADQNQFLLPFRGEDFPFIPDYGSKPLVRGGATSSNGSACSLNHYLAEGLLLLRAGVAYYNAEYLERGYAIMDALDASALSWIKADGNLWYAIRPDGEMEKNDYIDVTYLDLIDACALLNKLGKWDEYPSIQALLATKEEWLISHGYAHIVRPHAAYTAFG